MTIIQNMESVHLSDIEKSLNKIDKMKKGDLDDEV